MNNPKSVIYHATDGLATLSFSFTHSQINAIITCTVSRNEKCIRVIQGILCVSELISSDAKKKYDRSFPRAVHVPRYALLWPAYFYGIPPSSNSRHSAATERNYHIGARVQAGKRTLFVLRLDLLRPFFQPIAPHAFNPLSESFVLSTARGFKIKFRTLEGPTANFISSVLFRLSQMYKIARRILRLMSSFLSRTRNFGSLEVEHPRLSFIYDG